ncbi:MAG: hypothetical protein ACHQ1H_05660, partial [Nitrososphaerales archaeon]
MTPNSAASTKMEGSNPRSAMLHELIEETRQICAGTLSRPEFRALAQRMANEGHSEKEICSLVSIYEDEHPGGLQNLKASISQTNSDYLFERFVITLSALHSVDRIPECDVPLKTKQLICESFQFIARPDQGSIPFFKMGHGRFEAMCKTASLLRYPAGQLDWEISGLPRSTFLYAPFQATPRLMYFVAAKVGGFRPLMTSHLGVHRPSRYVLTAQNINKSYYSIANIMKSMPSIKGFYSISWLFSPDTLRISPHLDWMSKLFQENGGLVVRVGRADLDSGVFDRSPERKKAFEQGKFVPTEG